MIYKRVAIAVPIVAVLLASTVMYWRCAKLIDQRLRLGQFAGTSDIYAASPPTLITNVSERNRERRRMVTFGEMPKVLLDAVISAEDKRFFRHEGFDGLRILKAAYVDFRDQRKDQGASTISMQLARSLLLSREKYWERKITEVAMAVRLESQLTKKQIFEYYCNNVYLGRRGAFSIHGFGAASQAFLDKDITALTVADAATLAGIIQRPSYYNPARYPERLTERRNLVLSQMRQNGYLDDAQYRAALASPLTLSSAKSQSGGASYFVDQVSDEVQRNVEDGKAAAVYTTLDMELQAAANEAVRIGMQNVDTILTKRAGKNAPVQPKPQVALVALDPNTGEVKALVGGRDYAESQLNHALARRQPGSVFKPFVYAAALNTALNHTGIPITPATLLVDEPTTFWSGDQAYAPNNFGRTFSGEVTVRDALARSMNVPTVKLAEMVGYRSVANLARQAGLGSNVQATPSIALGSYEATPLDMAGAYTIFANHGIYVQPSLIREVRARDGGVIWRRPSNTHTALDPRVAYLMENLLEEVLRTGTGAGVRSRGFSAPAAGKTGTSRDGWFAGFTAKLVCVVWVGFDDNHELGLEGAKSAAPIWAEFMKRAVQVAPYRDAAPYRPPPGISSAQIDPETGGLASPNCPRIRTEFFVTGDQPAAECALHNAPQSAASGAIVEVHELTQ